MQKLESEVISLVKELAKTIKKVGVRKVYKVLNDINDETKSNSIHHQIIIYTINQTCKEFQVSKSEIKKKNIRGNIIEARAMCFIILKKHLDLKHEDIAKLFGRSNHTLVSNALNNFKHLNAQIKKDRIFLEKFQLIDSKVEKHKNLIFIKES
jgi:chromosomal replication initiation ATPase DnaA